MVWRYRVLGEAVASALMERPEVEVVAVTGGAEEAERILGRLPADVALLDASLDTGGAVDLAYLLAERFPRLRVLPFGLPSEAAAVPFIEAGAAGCLVREAGLDEVVEVVVGAARGSAPASLALVARVVERIEELDPGERGGPPESLEKAGLTGREEEVLELVARGLANKEIAHRLGIRTATVKNHVHAVLTKLGVGRRREAVRLAYESGLLSGPLRWRPLDED